jgi:glycosyltransferase involved in cell wall biosynthesis
VLDRGCTARLTNLGSGPEQASQEALARELDLGDHLHLAGSMPEDEVRKALADADMFLLPSHAEPLGVVVMEAMAMGVPVIVTRAGGVAEIVTDGVDGLMVPPGDAPALAEAVLALANDPQRGVELGAAGRRSVVERFDARVGARKLLTLLPHGTTTKHMAYQTARYEHA